ncbi:MAG: M56 family metallopeptidase [Ferruginibacter sp.]
MQLPFFEQAYLLSSVGWAIANSFWQAGTLWLLYQIIISIDKKLPAVIKYHLSLVLLFGSFLWFLFTTAQIYQLLKGSNFFVDNTIFDDWLKFAPLKNVLPFLSIIYFFSLGGLVLQFLRNLYMNRVLQKQSLSRAPFDVRLFVNQTALHLGVKKKIQVWISHHVEVPSVTGFIKPLILLPVAITNHLTIPQIEAILLHELAHIKRNDYLVNLVQSLIEMILFFNPFAIFLSRAAKKQRENCCDDWVMNFKYSQYDYAKALLVLEEQRHKLQVRYALAATSGKKKLLERVKRLFNSSPNTNFKNSYKFKLAALVVLLLAAILAVKPVRTDIQENNKQLAGSQNQNLITSIPEQFNVETASKSVFTTVPAKSIKNKKSLIKRKANKQPAKDPGDLVNAYINEELLNPSVHSQSSVFQAAQKEVSDSSLYYIKIEEQQSGKKQINTYYFELDNNDGNPAIKPLIMLNKFRSVVKKGTRRNIINTLHITKKLHTKKRTTS